MGKSYKNLLSVITFTIISVLIGSAANAQFITKWKTSAANDSITIPTFGGGYNYSVNWGDGSTSNGHIGDATHKYLVPGNYTVTITGTFPQIWFGFADNNLRIKIVEISQWGENAWRSMQTAFQGCSNINLTATDIPNLNGVNNMSYMFAGCSSLNPTGDAAKILNSWNTSTITNMAWMFRGAVSFNQDIGKWNTSAVTNMNAMFYGATSFDQNIGDWNTGSVTNMSFMLSAAKFFNQDISKWNTSSVTNTNALFYEANSFNQDIGNWNTKMVTNMSFMFASANSFNQNINNWNTESVLTMASMFQEATSMNHPLGNWNTASVMDMSYMFYEAIAFNRDINNWNTGSVNKMGGMFTSAIHFNQDIGNWNTASVNDMSRMFYRASSFNQNVSKWNTGAVTKMNVMFREASSFDQNLGNWNIQAVNDMTNMLDYSNLSSNNYDNTLIGWSLQEPANKVTLGALQLTYCHGENARTSLISTFGWTINGDHLECALPIDLISFYIKQSAKRSVEITWVTGVEQNVQSMAVQHSTNAGQWETIFISTSKGSNSQYTTVDNNPAPGINFYRLLTTDLDGSRQFSFIRSLNFSASLLPNVYPNPTSGVITIRNIKSGDVIVLTDVTGRQMLKKQASADTQMLDIHSLAQGMYFISIMRDGKVVVNDKITKM